MVSDLRSAYHQPSASAAWVSVLLKKGSREVKSTPLEKSKKHPRSKGILF